MIWGFTPIAGWFISGIFSHPEMDVNEGYPHDLGNLHDCVCGSINRYIFRQKKRVEMVDLPGCVGKWCDKPCNLGIFTAQSLWPEAKEPPLVPGNLWSPVRECSGKRLGWWDFMLEPLRKNEGKKASHFAVKMFPQKSPLVAYIPMFAVFSWWIPHFHIVSFWLISYIQLKKN